MQRNTIIGLSDATNRSPTLGGRADIGQKW
jgi:hypothetical protein